MIKWSANVENKLLILDVRRVLMEKNRYFWFLKNRKRIFFLFFLKIAEFEESGRYLFNRFNLKKMVFQGSNFIYQPAKN